MLMVIIVLFALVSALTLIQVDQELRLTPHPDQVWLYGGGADSATALLSAVTSSAITVAGVVFSATFVTLQLASSQYSPRVVQALSRRWSLHVVLGTFLANFVYSLVVLRSVRPSTSANAEEFVPVLSVSVCVILSVACVGVLVYYITSGMQSLQPTNLINSAALETVRLLERSRLAADRFPSVPASALPIDIDSDFRVLTARSAGFIQRIQFRKLLAVAGDANVIVRIDGEIGRHYYPGERVVSIWPHARCTPQVEHQVRKTIFFGDERTPEQDIEYGFRRVADIMLKAVSAAINDPTTAQYCVGTLGSLVVSLSTEDEPQRYLVDQDGIVRIIWNPPSFDRCVRTAFGQLRFYASRDVTLVIHVMGVLQRVVTLVPEHRQSVILEQAMAFRDAALRDSSNDRDYSRIQEASGWIILPA